ncbi:MBL fold metallo-hydrolase [Thermodesulfobacteriota bacterium]
MIITEPGKITERITLLGCKECCVYNVDGGDEIVWIGGAMSYVIPDILQQMKDFGIDERTIKRIFILHSHYDHCGYIPYFKKRCPWIKVNASKRAKKILANPKISKNIAAFNEETLTGLGLNTQIEGIDLAFTGIEVEETVGEGEVVSCGNLDLEVLEVPGHSSCSIAIYIPQEKALFGSDAIGVRHDREFFMPSGNSDFNLFQQNLEKMTRYNVDLVLGDHFGASVGKDAREYLPRSIEAAQKLRARIEASYSRTRDIKKASEEVTDYFMNEVPVFFFPREVMFVVVEQMVKCIARDL